MTGKVLILNGPNLNLLGTREPDVYGSMTLEDIEKECTALAQTLDLEIGFRQSNSEGELVDWIQQAPEQWDGLIINPAAYSHTSIAIADALRMLSLPVLEVHISNIFARETFRHHSHISAVASGIICGLGPSGYMLALDAMNKLIQNKATG